MREHGQPVFDLRMSVYICGKLGSSRPPKAPTKSRFVGPDDPMARCTDDPIAYGTPAGAPAMVQAKASGEDAVRSIAGSTVEKD